ncbi:hypothetical protein Ocin01_16289 [Orchesella cincta]|uniref:rRNA-processing protein FYV7 n=1 Tax=Orchesella cincta TaxID=48709 RepID=A0A1D2MBP5_ORCCI|nr:hypothetical protein Ocin01_16289 [Orchesella cincta]
MEGNKGIITRSSDEEDTPVRRKPNNQGNSLKRFKKGKNSVAPAYLSMLNSTIGPGTKPKTGTKKGTNDSSSAADRKSGGSATPKPSRNFSTPKPSRNAATPKIKNGDSRFTPKSRRPGRFSEEGANNLAAKTPDFMKVKEDDSARQKKERRRYRNKIMNLKTAKGQPVMRGRINLMLEKIKADLNV